MIEEKLDKIIELLEKLLQKPVYSPYYPTCPSPIHPTWTDTATDNGTAGKIEY